jgi:hypothetical protein
MYQKRRIRARSFGLRWGFNYFIKISVLTDLKERHLFDNEIVEHLVVRSRSASATSEFISTTMISGECYFYNNLDYSPSHPGLVHPHSHSLLSIRFLHLPAASTQRCSILFTSSACLWLSHQPSATRPVTQSSVVIYGNRFNTSR